MCVSFIPSIHPSICQPAYLPACLPACLSQTVSIYIQVLFHHLCLCQSIIRFDVHPTSLPVCPCIFLSFCPSIYLSIYLSICMSVCQSACLAQSHQDILKLHQSLHPNTLFLSGPLAFVSITDSLSILSVSSPLCLHLHNLQVLAHCFTAEFRL